MDLKVLQVEVAKMQLKPTDILVMKLPFILEAEHRTNVRTALEAFRGDGGKVLVLDKGCDLAILEQSKAV